MTTPTVTRAVAVRSLALPPALRLIAPLVGVLLLHLVLARVVAPTLDWSRAAAFLGPLALRSAIVITTLALVVVVALVLRARHRDVPWPDVPRVVRQHWTPERVALALATPVTLTVMIAVYGGWKSQLVVVAPPTWDATLIALERTLHLGRLPVEWASQFPEGVVRTFAAVYGHPWYLLAIGLPPLAALAAPLPLARRLIVACVLVWSVLGGVLAHLLPAVGPCFLADVAVTPDAAAPYLAWDARLRVWHTATPITAVAAQDWLTSVDGTATFAAGRSALPSLHVAVATLLALAGWAWRRWLGVALAGYAVVVMVGSVVLNWHYALDGYTGAAGAALLWWTAGRLTRRASAAASPPVPS